MFFGGSILYITEECLVSEWHISSGPATPNLIVGRLKWIFIIPISKLFFFFLWGVGLGGWGVGGVVLPSHSLSGNSKGLHQLVLRLLDIHL